MDWRRAIWSELPCALSLHACIQEVCNGSTMSANAISSSSVGACAPARRALRHRRRSSCCYLLNLLFCVLQSFKRNRISNEKTWKTNGPRRCFSQGHETRGKWRGRRHSISAPHACERTLKVMPGSCDGILRISVLCNVKHVRVDRRHPMHGCPPSLRWLCACCHAPPPAAHAAAAALFKKQGHDRPAWPSSM